MINNLDKKVEQATETAEQVQNAQIQNQVPGMLPTQPMPGQVNQNPYSNGTGSARPTFEETKVNGINQVNQGNPMSTVLFPQANTQPMPMGASLSEKRAQKKIDRGQTHKKMSPEQKAEAIKNKSARFTPKLGVREDPETPQK
jgi:hypothetical protein